MIKKINKVFVALLGIAIVIFSAGIHKVNAETIEHVETQERQVNLNISDGKTAYISVNKENNEKIGYTELYKLIVSESGITMELTENESEAFLKIVKASGTMYNVTALNDEWIELSMNVVTFKTKKLVNTTIVDGIQNDYYLETTYKAIIRYGRTEPLLEEITEVNITIPSPIPGTETTIKEDTTYPGEYDWMSQTNKPEVIVPDGAFYTPIESYYGEEETYTYWICGFEDSDYWKPYIGKFEEGKDYIAEFTVFSKPGYKFTNNTIITVNGQEVEHIFDANKNELWLGQTITCKAIAGEEEKEDIKETEDTVSENAEEIKNEEVVDENPETGDSVYVYLVVLGMSVIILSFRKVLAK